MAPKTLPNLIFDLDGTLLNVFKRHYLVYKTVTQLLGASPLTPKIYWQLKRQKDLDEQIIKLSKITSINIFQDKFRQLIERPEYLALDVLQPNVIPTLKILSKTYSLTLLTLRQNKSAALRQLSRLGIDIYFQQIFIVKDKTRTIKLLYNHNPYNIIIGDTELDIQTAKAINSPAVALSWGIRSHKFLARYNPDVILRTLTQLTPQLISSLIQKSSEMPNQGTE